MGSPEEGYNQVCTHGNTTKNARMETMLWGFLGVSDGLKKKKTACNAGDLGLISGSGESPGEGNGYPLQYSCLKNCLGRGAWQATVHQVTKSQT